MGVFIDSPVQGLGYTCVPSGLSGLTNASGQYNYLPGDTVTFTLYGRTIGAAVTAGPVVTALSVFNATSLTDPQVVNLSQLLLTLAGGAPAPGSPIVLPANAPQNFPVTLDFSAVGFDALFQGLVLEATAIAHLQANFSTLSVTLAGTGSVTSNPAGLNCGAICSADFSNGTAVTLTATGAGFTGWSGGCTGTGACAVTLNANTAVTATFIAVPVNANLTVTKAGNGAGTVTSSPAGINCGAICSASLVQGTVDLTAIAANGSTFAGWSNGPGNAICAGTGACSIPLTVDSTVIATFTLSAVPVSVTANVASGNGGSGTVTCLPNGGVVPCGSYLPGTAMVLMATPDSVSNFSGWSGSGCSGTGTCSFTVTSATSVTANFNRPVLTVQVNGIGSVSSNPADINSCTTNCSAPFNKGAVTLTASGTGFTSWSGGGCSGTGTCQVTLTTDATVTANFGGAGLPSFAQAALDAYVKASNTGVGDKFGTNVALDGDTLAVGADSEASAATGVGGNQADNGAPFSGAVYVFTRTGGVWSQQAYLKASNTGAFDQFGTSVALSGDTLAVGADSEDSAATGVNGNQADNSAPGSGAVYLFTRNPATGVWSQQAYVKASNTRASDLFGTSVALSGDTLAVGASREDSAATGVNGDQADNSAIFDSGAVYVFTRTGGVWSQQAYLKASNTGASDLFGTSVALSGDTLAVGAFEASAATGVNGNQADNSAPLSGAVYVFTRTGGVWSQQAYLKASNTGQADLFGTNVALSGDTLAVVAPLEDSAATGVNGNQADNSALESGAVYVFTRTGGVWSQQAYVKASNTGAGDRFGWSVALNGDTLAVGALNENSAATGINGDQTDDSALESGAVYVFTRTGGVWSQQAYVKASNTGANDRFGTSVALSGDTLAVGADSEDRGATGVNGDQANDSAVQSGAVYVYRAR